MELKERIDELVEVISGKVNELKTVVGKLKTEQTELKTAQDELEARPIPAGFELLDESAPQYDPATHVLRWETRRKRIAGTDNYIDVYTAVFQEKPDFAIDKQKSSTRLRSDGITLVAQTKGVESNAEVTVHYTLTSGGQHVKSGVHTASVADWVSQKISIGNAGWPHVSNNAKFEITRVEVLGRPLNASAVGFTLTGMVMFA
ncbi:hypothetical protein [Bergeriella denitrificans]|uniref:Uncharacterized protein n=1 Tax=Bergeriella denitrificans TaxID=494 RepID=A0A378UHY5_BERDE|nr:hypothetical protein [Bergeriella denitrificans]STZ76353.1 Uncharacterised protein [Bergeriella denitrificans]